MCKASRSLFALLALASAADSQDPVIVVQDAERVVVNDNAQLAYIQQDRLYLDRGFGLPARWLYAGVGGFPPLFFDDYPNAYVEEFGPLALDASGNLHVALSLSDPQTPALTQGLYRGGDLVLINGDDVQAPTLDPSTSWLSFDGLVQVNEGGRILVSGTVADPSIPGFADEVLATLDLDVTGVPSSVNVLAVESGPAPGLPSFSIPSGGLPRAQSRAAINAAGDVLWSTRLTGPSGVESAIYLNDQVVLMEGEPSPLPGLDWGRADVADLDLNSAGDWLVRTEISPAPQNQRDVLVKNGAIVAREGDVLPNGFTLRVISETTPVALTDGGRVVYVASLLPFLPPNGFDAVLVDDEIVALAGVTRVEGLLLESIVDGRDSLAVSPDGRYVVFEARLEFGVNAWVRLDLGRVRSLSPCTPNEGLLSHLGGVPVVGGSIDLGMDNAQSVSAVPYVLFSTSTVPSFPPCGLATGFGELLINVGTNGDPFYTFELFTGQGTLWFAQNPALINLEVYAQGLFLDLGATPPVRLTNGLEIEIGS